MLNSKNKILVLIPTLGDTKDSRRIKLLKDSNFDVNAAYFERNQFSPRIPVADNLIKLGNVSDGKYFKRVFIFVRSIFKIRELVKKNNLIYSIGADLAILAFFSSIGLKKKIIIDIADIRPIQVSDSIFGNILRGIESFVTKRASLIVVTSSGFIDYYYKKTLGLSDLNFFLLENKVDYEIPIGIHRKRIKSDKIVLGYFGIIRDKWTLIFLNKLLERFPERFDVVVAGINLLDDSDFKEQTTRNPGMHYLGPYQSPGDLPELYQLIDVMVVFYPEFNSSTNWFNAKRICRSNRFYEASYFNIPLICFSFSDDGKEVEKLQIGLTLDDYDFERGIENIERNLNIKNIKLWKTNLNSISSSRFKLMDEYMILANKIIEIINYD